MALTQERVLTFLLERGGKVRNSELVNNFRSHINLGDPAQRQHNRELFKKLVNSVAVVRHVDEVKFVVVKKRYQDFVKEAARDDPRRAQESFSGLRVAFTSPHRPQSAEMLRSDVENNNVCRPAHMSGGHRGRNGRTAMESTQGPCQKRGASPDTTVKVLNISGDQLAREMQEVTPSVVKAKRPVGCNPPAFPRPSPTARPPDREKMPDARLAQRKDFMSGFTALHWAAKAGNSEMIQKLMDVSRKRGTHLDVDSKAHGGYTPLHVAAMHGHTEAMRLLVQGYRASVNERDNDGKKAHHYLGKGVSAEVRALMGGLQQGKSREKAEDEDTREQPKGFNTISKLFQPHVGRKQKHAARFAQDW